MVDTIKGIRVWKKQNNGKERALFFALGSHWHHTRASAKQSHKLAGARACDELRLFGGAEANDHAAGVGSRQLNRGHLRILESILKQKKQ